MKPDRFKQARKSLDLTQAELAKRLNTTRMTITRYEGGTRRIPGVVEVALTSLATSPRIPMAGIVAAGDPIEPVPQSELVEVPSSMVQGRETFALRVKGDSMRDEGVLPSDIVIVHKQVTARNGQTVVALVNNEATIKKYYRKEGRIELHPANAAMQPIILAPTDEFEILGVVIGVIRYCK
ncbi:transcriptional repressor LexA [Nitrospiraceae bacterium AH_259_D15_M11_P09]|nr:transcriptional repressor LexA [Nitrospiraceae bacterium AH_259_D15_M11_P09]